MPRIILSLIASILAGELLGFIAAKILVTLQFFGLSLFFALALGLAAGRGGAELARWSRISIMGIICALIIGLYSYFTYQYQTYLSIKSSFSADTPTEVRQLKTSQEPAGFFKYAQLTAFDEVQIVSRRRRESYLAKMGVWIIEIVIICVEAFVLSRDPIED